MCGASSEPSDYSPYFEPMQGICTAVPNRARILEASLARPPRLPLAGAWEERRCVVADVLQPLRPPRRLGFARGGSEHVGGGVETGIARTRGQRTHLRADVRGLIAAGERGPRPAHDCAVRGNGLRARG